MNRVPESVIKNLLLYFDRDPVADPRCPPGLLKKAFQALLVNGLLNIIEMLSTDS